MNCIVRGDFFLAKIRGYAYYLKKNEAMHLKGEKMTTKEKLAKLLEEQNGAFLSGNVIASQLGITRAAIWKNIKQLEKDGYEIEAVTNKGYRLSASNDAVTEGVIREYLGEQKDLFFLDVRKSVTSTNTLLKEKAAELPDWYVLVAGNQTAGRGRAGRAFFSPAETGVYLSILLRPDIPVSDAGKLTTAAAVAACRAISHCTEEEPKIKWVNDVFLRERKVCGILTEASVNFETGKPDWIVTGIGFNVYPPEEELPEELSGIAGAIAKERKKDLRCRIAAEFILAFYELCRDLSGAFLYQEYKERCFVIGEEVFLLRGDKKIPAVVLDLLPDFSLLVRYEDGTTEALSAGEVSIRPKKK